MANVQPQWQVKGIYNEACASEGHCPYYFGRAKEGGCRYFMVFRIVEGKVEDVDLAGMTVIYVGDLPHSTYADVMTKGSEGAVYLSESATPEQRRILDTFSEQALGGVLMKRIYGKHYVKVEVEEQADSVSFKIPTGEMKMQLTRSHDGKPVRIENATLPFLTNIKAGHTPYWNWSDHDRSYDYKNRCGTWADFAM